MLDKTVREITSIKRSISTVEDDYQKTKTITRRRGILCEVESKDAFSVFAISSYCFKTTFGFIILKLIQSHTFYLLLLVIVFKQLLVLS
jgi:hypothetical protein